MAAGKCRKIRVLLAEDHVVVRSGLKILITAAPAIEVAGETGNGHDAVVLAEKLQPDVVLMDVRLPKMDGREATRRIVRAAPNSKVLVLSSYSDDESVE